MLQDGAPHSGSSVGENPGGELGRSGSRMKRGRGTVAVLAVGLVWFGRITEEGRQRLQIKL